MHFAILLLFAVACRVRYPFVVLLNERAKLEGCPGPWARASTAIVVIIIIVLSFVKVVGAWGRVKNVHPNGLSKLPNFATGVMWMIPPLLFRRMGGASAKQDGPQVGGL